MKCSAIVLLADLPEAVASGAQGDSHHVPLSNQDRPGTTAFVPPTQGRGMNPSLETSILGPDGHFCAACERHANLTQTGPLEHFVQVE